jgi:hypothetical protein
MAIEMPTWEDGGSLRGDCAVDGVSANAELGDVRSLARSNSIFTQSCPLNDGDNQLFSGGTPCSSKAAPKAVSDA